MTDLNPRQFGPDVTMFHPNDLGFMASRDHAGKLRDMKFAPGGESDQRVRKIMETASTEGIREPLEVNAKGTPYLHDGHHRYEAARRLDIHIPVRGY